MGSGLLGEQQQHVQQGDEELKDAASACDSERDMSFSLDENVDLARVAAGDFLRASTRSRRSSARVSFEGVAEPTSSSPLRSSLGSGGNGGGGRGVGGDDSGGRGDGHFAGSRGENDDRAIAASAKQQQQQWRRQSLTERARDSSPVDSSSATGTDRDRESSGGGGGAVDELMGEFHNLMAALQKQEPIEQVIIGSCIVCTLSFSFPLRAGINLIHSVLVLFVSG